MHWHLAMYYWSVFKEIIQFNQKPHLLLIFVWSTIVPHLPFIWSQYCRVYNWPSSSLQLGSTSWPRCWSSSASSSGECWTVLERRWGRLPGAVAGHTDDKEHALVAHFSTLRYSTPWYSTQDFGTVGTVHKAHSVTVGTQHCGTVLWYRTPRW